MTPAPTGKTNLKRYLIIIEQGEGNLSAYVPDVPGCVTVGDTVKETLANMKEALEFHFEGMSSRFVLSESIYHLKRWS